MGKASRWMINFLLGKKEEKGKKKYVSFCEEDVTVPATPSYKRRWSFGKSANKERFHKSSKSVDSINGIPSPEIENQKTQFKPLARNEAIAKPTHARERIDKAVEDAAATRIQAAFRSLLARKALHALRGLVKLQALVRGHQVRKQTTAVLRQMHALMSIQVRARFHRIQMADDSQLVVKSQSLRHTKENGFGATNRDAIDRDLREMLRRRDGYLSDSKREHHFEELSFLAPENSPNIYYSAPSKMVPGRASFTSQKPDYLLHPVSHQCLAPNYMTNTESSRAKTRSQSEPKQRPICGAKPKNKRTASIDATITQNETRTECSPSHLKRKLCPSTRLKDRDIDAESTNSSYSNYSKFLVTYEPHLHLY